MKLPREFKLIYTALHDQAEYFSFDPGRALHREGQLVSLQRNGPPLPVTTSQAAVWLSTIKGMEHRKGDVSFYQFCIGRMITIALEASLRVKRGDARASS